MSAPDWEQRIANLEIAVASLLKERSAAPLPSVTADSTTHPGTFDAADVRAMEPSSRYIRQTGDVPPNHWKRGDPIPEPSWWQSETNGENRP